MSRNPTVYVGSGVVETQKSSGTVTEKEDASMEIKVLFFARAREITGLADILLELPRGSTTHDCMSKLLTKFPQLEEVYNSMVLALNEEYVVESTILRNRDEVAIIPPISGG